MDSNLKYELDKEKILNESKRLKAVFKDLDKEKKKVTNKLIENAAFMSVLLDFLQEQISLNGCISEYQNGENQWGTKKSPEMDVYNTTIKNYTVVIKQLTDYLPKEVAKVVEQDEFDKF